MTTLRFRVDVRCDHIWFHGKNHGHEIARILRDFADRITYETRADLERAKSNRLVWRSRKHDSKGNSIGTAKVI